MGVRGGLGGLDPLTVYLAIRNPLMHRVKRERERAGQNANGREGERERERGFL